MSKAEKVHKTKEESLSDTECKVESRSDDYVHDFDWNEVTCKRCLLRKKKLELMGI